MVFSFTRIIGSSFRVDNKPSHPVMPASNAFSMRLLPQLSIASLMACNSAMGS